MNPVWREVDAQPESPAKAAITKVRHSQPVRKLVLRLIALSYWCWGRSGKGTKEKARRLCRAFQKTKNNGADFTRL